MASYLADYPDRFIEKLLWVEPKRLRVRISFWERYRKTWSIMTSKWFVAENLVMQKPEFHQKCHFLRIHPHVEMHPSVG